MIENEAELKTGIPRPKGMMIKAALRIIRDNEKITPLNLANMTIRFPGYSSPTFFYRMGYLVGLLQGNGFVKNDAIRNVSRLSITKKGRKHLET